ncbi:hypothetical protein CC78DRAFT_570582 [Lojkania enalia]|uniref:Uncharacterized protein n=1 Tax=Lojkania enalia TaxID=147567 RepID=A0A9P4N728_9PLEO|nr:hypothetical protein CC78DRAFT_570582 [Didymosphaeria enalia]
MPPQSHTLASLTANGSLVRLLSSPEIMPQPARFSIQLNHPALLIGDIPCSYGSEEVWALFRSSSEIRALAFSSTTLTLVSNPTIIEDVWWGSIELYEPYMWVVDWTVPSSGSGLERFVAFIQYVFLANLQIEEIRDHGGNFEGALEEACESIKEGVKKLFGGDEERYVMDGDVELRWTTERLEGKDIKYESSDESILEWLSSIELNDGDEDMENTMSEGEGREGGRILLPLYHDIASR